MRLYAMSLVERLGFKTLKELYKELDNNDIMEWLAYDKCNDTEYREKLERQISLEKQKQNTAEQEAELIRAMFMGMGLK